jgi:hypothetical protein
MASLKWWSDVRQEIVFDLFNKSSPSGQVAAARSSLIYRVACGAVIGSTLQVGSRPAEE